MEFKFQCLLKVLMKQSQLFIHILSKTAFALQWPNYTVATLGTIWTTKPKILISWLFIYKVAKPWCSEAIKSKARLSGCDQYWKRE
jgi:hypothetical protein